MKTKNILLTNCPNCGAPLSSDGYCSYCGTKVRYANEVEFQTFLNYGVIEDIQPTEILLKFNSDDGTMIVIPFIGKPENIEIVYDSIDYTGRYGTVISKFNSGPHIKFDFTGTISRS